MEVWIRLITINSVVHVLAGLALSLVDRLLSRPRPASLKQRLARKRDALLLLEHLRKAETGTLPDDEPTPTQGEIDEAAVFLRALIRNGELDAPGANLPDPVSAGAEELRNAFDRSLAWLRYEKLNHLSALGQLKAAYILAILTDIAVVISQIAWGRGNGLAALAHSLYQGLALWIGIFVGSLFFKRRDERAPRRLRKEIERLEARLEPDPGVRGLMDRIAIGRRIAAGSESKARLDSHPDMNNRNQTPDTLSTGSHRDSSTHTGANPASDDRSRRDAVADHDAFDDQDPSTSDDRDPAHD